MSAVYVVQGHYSTHCGWEDLGEFDTREEARAMRAEYDMATPSGRHRVVRRTVKDEESTR